MLITCSNPTCTQEDCVIPYGTCHCGCGKLTRVSWRNCTTNGLVKDVPVKFIRNHDKRLSGVDYLIDEETGCWEWQLGRTGEGYGSKWVNGKTKPAHIYYYEEKYGIVPVGMVLDHFKCQNTGCCNPDHVEPTSQAENVHRGNKTVLDWEAVNKIREIGHSIPRNDLAKLFGVNPPSISRILNNTRWAVKLS